MIDLISGSGHKERPQFERMLSDAETGQFDVLVVYDSTRVGRNMDKVGGWTAQLRENGVARLTSAPVDGSELRSRS